MALIDGPFQRLVEKRGLMSVLTGWSREREEFKKAYEQERVSVDALIRKCLELPIGAVVIADDVAGERAPFVSPDDLQELCAPFYTQTLSEIHSGHGYALLHSCGNITTLIPDLVSYGFDGLAAIQHRTNDLITLKNRYGSTLTFMAGIEAEGRRALALTVDVTQKDQVEQMVEQVVRTFGRMDVFFNNAGIIKIHKFLDITEEAWDQIMAVNTKGVFLCGQAVARQMVRQGHGKIINTASIRLRLRISAFSSHSSTLNYGFTI